MAAKPVAQEEQPAPTPKAAEAAGLNARKEKRRFEPGQRCQVISVYHRVFEKEIGKFVIITKICPDSSHAWAYDDEPAKYRINRNGRQVIQFDPKSVRSMYNFDQLRPATETGETQNE